MFGLNKKELSWVLYDVGNSAYYTTIVAGFFPVFFKNYWHAGADATVSSWHLGLANSLSALVVALLAPLIGSIVDIGGVKKRYLIFFSAIGILSAILLSFIGKGSFEAAMWVFAIGMVGVATSNSVYDSQLTDVTEESRFHKVSATGYSLGYLGGGLLFALNVFMTLSPGTFGLADAAEAVKVSFLLVAIWWTLFLIPLLRNVHDKKPATGSLQRTSVFRNVTAGHNQLMQTLKAIIKNKQTLYFLVAYWLYIDGVGTIMKMAVDYGMSLGFESSDLIKALLLVQFLGFPAALIFGKLGDRIGAKNGLFIGIFIYGIVTVYAYYMATKLDFYIMAVLIACVQGGVQSLSRSLFAHLIPTAQSGEYFGLYNMLGKFAAVVGPILMGGVALLTGSTRVSMLSILVLFLGGALILTLVKEPTKNSVQG